MKVLIQIVQKAKVMVSNQLVSNIHQGYVLFVGIEKEDTIEVVQKMAQKIANLRINADDNGKTNLSILDTKKEILSISQFTLCAAIDGRRPSFSNAKDAQTAKEFYEIFNQELKSYGIVVKEGEFQKHMEVFLVNDGPFTIYMDSQNF